MTYYNKLLSLGIPAEVIKEANISEDSYEGLYNRLKAPIKNSRNTFHFPLKVDAPWQLQALTGDMDAIDINKAKPDNWGATFAHYAAWSGNPDALQWVMDNHPGLLSGKNKFDEIITHYAAWSGNKEALKWVKTNKSQLFENRQTIAFWTVLSENEEAFKWIRNTHPELLRKKTKSGLNVNHIAALLGNVDTLEKLHTIQPELLTDEDKDACTIAHFAARSGNPGALDWVRKHYPDLLTAKDKDACTIAHSAAWSGNPDALEWVKTHHLNLLNLQTKRGKTIAFYAASSKKPEALQWVADNMDPGLITDDQYIVRCAAKEGNSKLLNIALKLSKTPHSFILRYANNKHKATLVTNLLNALEDNFTLTEVKLPEGIDPALKQKIADKVSRNQKLEKRIQEFSTLVEAWGKNPNMSQLPSEILFNIFKQLIPSEVPKNRSSAAFTKIVDNNSPKNRLKIKKDLCNNAIKKAQKKMVANNKKSSILTTLNNLISKENSSSNDLNKAVIAHYLKYENAINQQRNKIHTVFSPEHKTSTSKVYDNIFNILNIKESDINAVRNENDQKKPGQG